MADLAVVTRRDCEMVDITGLVNAAIPASLRCGTCTIFVPHTTAGITINENVDPDVRFDILKKLDLLVPRKEGFYRHAEGNSAAHVKASLLGNTVTVPVRNGRLRLGTWQGIYLCEFDGPRTRQVQVLFQEASC